VLVLGDLMLVLGVPFFIFNGRIAVSGAHDPATLLEAIAAARRDI
jgi:predicted DsbA family dithiol-disulfide isomerase